MFSYNYTCSYRLEVNQECANIAVLEVAARLEPKHAILSSAFEPLAEFNFLLDFLPWPLLGHWPMCGRSPRVEVARKTLQRCGRFEFDLKSVLQGHAVNVAARACNRLPKCCCNLVRSVMQKWSRKTIVLLEWLCMSLYESLTTASSYSL